jgi:hypothetical protein
MVVAVVYLAVVYLKGNFASQQVRENRPSSLSLLNSRYPDEEHINPIGCPTTRKQFCCTPV